MTASQTDIINFFKDRLHNKLEALRLYLSNVYANVPVTDDSKNVKNIIQNYKDVLLSYDLINILTLMKQNSTDPITETTDEIIYYVVFLVSIFVSLGMITNVDTVYNATYTTTREQFIKGLESFTLTGTTVGENIEKVLTEFLDHTMGNTKAENRIYSTKTMVFSANFDNIRNKIMKVLNELQKLCEYKYTKPNPMNQTCDVWQLFSFIVEIIGRVEYAMLTSIITSTIKFDAYENNWIYQRAKYLKQVEEYSKVEQNLENWKKYIYPYIAGYEGAYDETYGHLTKNTHISRDDFFKQYNKVGTDLVEPKF